MSAQAVLDEPSVEPRVVQYFEFGFEAVPGSPDPLPPRIQVVGPPSLTVLVTEKEADVLLTLTQVGLPEGTEVFFDETDPICWHPYQLPAPCLPQPEWVTQLEPKPHQITYHIENPATAQQPVVIAFTPRVSYTALNGGNAIPVDVPDPTIVNIDPTGG